MKVLRVKIANQGRPEVSGVWLWRNSPKIVALTVSLTTKYCTVEARGNDGRYPLLVIEPPVNLNDPEQLRDVSTELAFIDYPGWDVWAAEISKYSLNVCLVKRRTAKS